MSILNKDYTLIADSSTLLSNVPLSADYMFFATGTFGGGCLSLEASPDGGVNWFTVDQLKAPGRLIRYLVSGEKVRLKLSLSANANINAGIRQ